MQGWQCPKCERCLSPDTKTCPFCPAKVEWVPIVNYQGWFCSTCNCWVPYGESHPFHGFIYTYPGTLCAPGAGQYPYNFTINI